MSRWKDCSKSQPDTERQVIVARPDRDTTEMGMFLRPEHAWVDHNSIAIHPTLWREMPKHPFAGAEM